MARPLGWWGEMVGSGFPVDTDRFRVLCIDWLGKHSAPFRPATNGSGSSRPTRKGTRRYPVISTQDQAAAAMADWLEKHQESLG